MSSDRVKLSRFSAWGWYFFQLAFLKFQLAVFLKYLLLVLTSTMQMVTGTWSLPPSWSMTSLMECFCTFPVALRPIWRSTALSLRNKIRIFNTSVKSVLLYGSETWCVTKTNTHKVQTFTNRCLRNILSIRWPEVVSNEQLWDKTKQTQLRQRSENASGVG